MVILFLSEEFLPLLIQLCDSVGVDIACRMKLSVVDYDVNRLLSHEDKLIEAIEEETLFGMGKEFSKKDNIQ